MPKQDAAEKAPLQILALWARFPELIAETAAVLEETVFGRTAGCVCGSSNGDSFSPAHLLDLLPSQKHRQIISRLLIEDNYDEKTAGKALADCVKYLKCVHIAQQRKEIEAQMAKLDTVAAKGEIAELSKKWLELRKMEESINQAKEGGKGVE